MHYRILFFKNSGIAISCGGVFTFLVISSKSLLSSKIGRTLLFVFGVFSDIPVELEANLFALALLMQNEDELAIPWIKCIITL